MDRQTHSQQIPIEGFDTVTPNNTGASHDASTSHNLTQIPSEDGNLHTPVGNSETQDDAWNLSSDVKPVFDGESETPLHARRGDGDASAYRGVHTQRSHDAFPGWSYAVFFVVFDMLAVAILQWGVSDPSTGNDFTNFVSGFWSIFSKMWTDLNFVFVLNLLLLGIVYVILLMLTNRFWVASPIFLALAIIISVVEHFKVEIRYEAILPSDLSFLGSDTGSLLSFMPSGSLLTIAFAALGFLALVGVFVWLHHLDGRRGRMFQPSHRALGAVSRLLLVLIPALAFGFFTVAVSTVGSWANSFSSAMGDIPSMWDSVYDAQRNGPVVSFIRQLNPKIMDEPANYSEATMKAVAKRYAAEANTINQTRTASITDSTVVYILSESFSDPSRVPGLALNKDSLPDIRKIKSDTTSGLMLSSGYGGGTANLEYMGLTSLSMVNFDPSLTSPYQQLVPGESWTPTINQQWGSPTNSQAFHPYEPSMYSRAGNYKKFGFSHFYALTGPDIIAHQQKIDDSPYVSDASAYQSAFDEISATNSNQFIQVITMQNHMPYHSWYKNNEFKATSTDPAKPLGTDETESIETYAKGVEYTDQATKAFLEQLDALDKPITVVFYGDHLPGIYSTAGADTNNALALHLTDYFIWSNKASGTQGTKDSNSAFSSPNFFSAQAAQYMNAKVSPYLAFMTQLHTKISAMEPPVVNKIQGWDRIPAGQSIFLNAQGQPMSEQDFDASTQQLMADYKLIQYDITAGKGYLKDTGFMNVPKS